MHARVIHANISNLAEAKRGLEEEIILGIKAARGFLGAYFVAIDDSHGIWIEVFETEELAHATSPPEGAEAPGVRVRTHPVRRGHRFGLIACAEKEGPGPNHAVTPSAHRPDRGHPHGASGRATQSRVSYRTRALSFGNRSWRSALSSDTRYWRSSSSSDAMLL